MTLEAPQDGPSLPATPPTAAQLQSLMNTGNHRAAAALLDGVDLAAETAADFLYYAAVCLGDVGRDKDAVELLERAVAGGFAPFWCTYHLGLFEARRGRPVHAACYYSIALILDPARTDIQSLLEGVVPGLDLVPLATAQCRRFAPETARVAMRSAEATLKVGNVAATAHYLTVAFALDPTDPAPREQLAELVAGVPQTALDSLNSEADEGDGPEQPGSNAGTPPSTQRLAALLNEAKFGEAAALLEDVDLAAELAPDLLYYAGVCFGSVDRTRSAIRLLKRAVEGGHPPFWCAFHLGLFEEKRGNRTEAAFYYSVAALLDPTRGDILPLLARVAPDAELELLRHAQTAASSNEAAHSACDRAAELVVTGKLAAAASCFAIALSQCPEHAEARSRLLEFAPDLSIEVVTGIDFDRRAAELKAALDQAAADPAGLARQLALAETIFATYAHKWHHSGRTLLPGLEQVLQRALGTKEIGLEPLCKLYDGLYFLYWETGAEVEDLRGFSERVAAPFAAAIRKGTGCAGLPSVTPRPMRSGPLRLGYLAQYAHSGPGNAIGPFIDHVLGGLSRHFGGDYKLVLYAWMYHDDEALRCLEDTNVLIRRFDAGSTVERIAAVASAIAADEIDILITDMNTAVPTVLFERRAAPIQIFYQLGMPFWPLANIDAVFCVWPTEYISPIAGFEVEKSFRIDLGPWNIEALAPEVDSAQITTERARFPKEARLIGNYGRLVKITPEFLEIAAELLARHPDLIVLLGGTGDSTGIREFIATHGLTGRLELVNRYVDGHLWGHLLEVFLDTFPHGGGISCREMMAKGRPVISMQSPWPIKGKGWQGIPTADGRESYVEIASRLLTDPSFYEQVCAATRQVVASEPGYGDYAATLDCALTAIVRRGGGSPS
jgi:tetratricopeptide (TPR) repeat protein